MTKKEMQAIVENLTENLAVRFGATINDVDMKVGGRMTKVAKAEGGLFDLDACRGLLAKAQLVNAEVLLGHFARTQAPAVQAAYELQGQTAPAAS